MTGNSTWQTYTSDLAMSKATSSYGASPDKFLSSVEGNVAADSQETAVAVVAIAGTELAENFELIKNVASGSEIKITGTNLSSAALTLYISADTDAVSDDTITAGAKTLSALGLSVASESTKTIKLNTTSTIATIGRVAALIDGVILYNVGGSSFIDPLG
jgi:hypothetical protein